MKPLLAVVLTVVFLTPPLSPGAPWPHNVNDTDLAYLRRILRETWRYLDHYVSPETGLPYDSNQAKDLTNTTNIGLYLASLCMAYKLGYVTEDYALARVTKILDSLDTYEHWQRLYNNWLDPEGKERRAKPGDNNISDYNKLPAGLIVARQTFPALAARITAFLDAIPWELFHEPETGKIYYAFDVTAREMRHPVYFFRGEDKILGHFLMIASGKVPPETWDRHDLSTEERDGVRYFQYGWQGGGLFMHFICGLFLDNRGTPLGRSAADFAWAQMIHAMNLGAPVWGWSACVAPNGEYLGMGRITDEIVTPHASALAIHLFPREVIDNLRRLETYGLARPTPVDGSPQWFGFRDAVNWRTGEIADKYLTLDQAMLFLSLVNYCEKGLLWRTFGADPMVRRGKELIADYRAAAQHRAEEERHIASQTWDRPSTFWLGREGDRRLEPGEVIHRSLWARSLSREPLRAATGWRVANHAGEILMEGHEPILLQPRETRRLRDLRILTDGAERGKTWTLEYETLHGPGVVVCGSESFFFPTYVDLSGLWLIAEGDDPSRAEAAYQDGSWAEMRVPARWEDGALPGYDGVAWYRLRFAIGPDVRARWGDRPPAVAFGAVDDADETYLNGQKIGGLGVFPPEEQTAWNVPRLYLFDASLLKEQNVLAVRVADWMGNGGIWRGPVAIGPSDELRKVLDAAR